MTLRTLVDRVVVEVKIIRVYIHYIETLECADTALKV